MQEKYILASVAVGSIGAMETAAILTGVDGQYLSFCVGAIGAILGAVMGLSINIKQNK